MAHRADKRPEEIQYLLRGKGLTFADVARECGLPESTPRTATRKPSIEGEWAIAYFLELPARFGRHGMTAKPVNASSLNLLRTIRTFRDLVTVKKTSRHEHRSIS